jgi:hypothetical protein
MENWTIDIAHIIPPINGRQYDDCCSRGECVTDSTKINHSILGLRGTILLKFIVEIGVMLLAN